MKSILFCFATKKDKLSKGISHITEYISNERNPKMYKQVIQSWIVQRMDIHYFRDVDECKNKRLDFLKQLVSYEKR